MLRYERSAIFSKNGTCPNCHKDLLREVHEEPPIECYDRSSGRLVEGFAWRCSGCRRMLFEDLATEYLHLAIGVEECVAP